MQSSFLFRTYILLFLLFGSVSSISFTKDHFNVISSPEAMPFSFINHKTNKLEGMMIDIVHLVSERGGFEITVRQTPFPAMIPTLRAKKADLISAAMIVTDERAKVVSFTTPVYSFGETLIVHRDDMKDYQNYADLKGEIIGAEIGTIYIDKLKNENYFKEVRAYDGVIEIMREVANGRLKGGIVDEPIIKYLMKEHNKYPVKIIEKYRPIMEGDVALIVHKDNKELLERLNQIIDEIKADGSLADIIKSWEM